MKNTTPVATCDRMKLHIFYSAFFIFAASLLLFSCGQRKADAKADFEKGLLLAYDFEPEDIVTTKNDTLIKCTSCDSIIGKLHGAALIKGYKGMGLSFDGNGWMETGLYQQPEHMTFSFWAKATTLPQKDVIPFGAMNDSTRLYVGFPPEDNTIGIGIGKDAYYGKGVPYNLDTAWHHYLLTRANGKVLLYVDSKLLLDSEDIISDNAGQYYFGALNKLHEGGAAVHHFIGVVDELRIWQRAFSKEDVSELFSQND